MVAESSPLPGNTFSLKGYEGLVLFLFFSYTFMDSLFLPQTTWALGAESMLI